MAFARKMRHQQRMIGAHIISLAYLNGAIGGMAAEKLPWRNKNRYDAIMASIEIEFL